jgi:pimeloyl-ACP methyl ester carboxylesterase
MLFSVTIHPSDAVSMHCSGPASKSIVFPTLCCSSSLVSHLCNISANSKEWTKSSPGNPGLLDFYIPFLSSIHDKASSTSLTILAHAHAGHTPGIGDGDMDALRYDLTTQIQNVIDAFDAIKLTFGTNIKVILLGHSVGSWLALQVSMTACHRSRD